jgi:hypothetical protein
MPVPFAAGFGTAVGLLTEPRFWAPCSPGFWDPGLALLVGPDRNDASSAIPSELARPSPSESDIRENETVRAAAKPDSALCFLLPLSELLGEFASESAFRFKADLNGGGGAMMALELEKFAGKNWPVLPVG